MKRQDSIYGPGKPLTRNTGTLGSSQGDDSKAAFQLLFANNPLPMWMYDLATLQFLEVNEAAVAQYGYSRDEFLTMRITDIRPLEDIPRLLENVDKGRPSLQISGEWQHRTKLGRVIDVEITSHTLEFAGRRTVLVVAQNISERKLAENALRDSEERYFELFANANDIVFTTDLEGNFTSLNKAGEKVTGYTVGEALKTNIADILGLKYLELARDMLGRKISSGGLTTYEVEIPAKDGHKITLEINTRLICKAEKPVGVQGIARDITERKNLEGQLRQAQKMEAIGRLAGGIAHDFNNLLGVILGYSELLKERIALTDPLSNHIEEIYQAGRRAALLTRQLLAFSRQQVLEPKVLNLNTVVRDVEKLLRRLIGENIELVVVPDQALGQATVDAGQIEQVIVNLAINARDAMPQGGKLTIETENFDLDEGYAHRHAAVRPGPYVMLAVSDTGVGMDPETQARIFEPFFTTKELGKGTGLGLATVYGIVKQSGGFIWVYSERAKGTTFKIYLPRVEQAIDSAAAGRMFPEPLRGSETILVVEDAEPLRKLARQLLQSSGYTVLEAASGAEAIEVARDYQGPIHLLLTDVVMPGMGGRKLAERLAAARPEMKVLYVTGYPDNAIVHHGVLDAGVSLLSKPFTRNALMQRVRETLSSSPPPKSTMTE